MSTRCAPVVDEFLRVMLEGSGIPADLESSIAKFPEIDQVRARLEERDIAQLMRMAGTDVQAGGGTAFTLLVPFVHQDDVARFLLTQWRSARSFIRRNNILWPMLEIPGISDEQALECFAFVEENLDAFVANCQPWWQSTDVVLELAKARMNRPGIKPAKQWVYLCVAMGSPHEAELVSLLRASQLSTTGITRRVADALLARLKASRADSPIQ